MEISLVWLDVQRHQAPSLQLLDQLLDAEEVATQAPEAEKDEVVADMRTVSQAAVVQDEMGPATLMALLATAVATGEGMELVEAAGANE